MKLRIRHHVNPLRLDFQVARADRLEVPPGSEVDVEIGSAEGQFLFERARQDRARLVVGLEIRRDLVDAVNARAAAEAPNVRAVFCNVNVELGALFAPGAVTRFFVNFPDPWFKRRQHKRRVVTEGLVADMHRALAPGGEVFFQSDVFDVALDALEVLEGRADLLANEAGPWSFWRSGNPHGVRSRREDYCVEAGLPVWRIRLRKG